MKSILLGYDARSTNEALGLGGEIPALTGGAVASRGPAPQNVGTRVPPLTGGAERGRHRGPRAALCAEGYHQRRPGGVYYISFVCR